MIGASYSDKNQVLDILVESFENNKSVNYIVKQDEKRKKRIRNLMDYSFEVCYRFGKVYLSNDKKACALIVLPDKKKTTLKSIFLDLKLILTCTGLSGARKAMAREAKIKVLHPKGSMHYLWFIGVDPHEQGKGIGSTLLQEIIVDASKAGQIVCLETSTERNLPWYQRFGFTIYSELNLGYQLYFLKNQL